MPITMSQQQFEDALSNVLNIPAPRETTTRNFERPPAPETVANQSLLDTENVMVPQQNLVSNEEPGASNNDDFEQNLGVHRSFDQDNSQSAINRTFSCTRETSRPDSAVITGLELHSASESFLLPL